MELRLILSKLAYVVDQVHYLLILVNFLAKQKRKIAGIIATKKKILKNSASDGIFWISPANSPPK